MRANVLAVGPLPPPHFGIATSMAQLSAIEDERLRVEVLDIADRRGLSNIGRLDLGNVVLALRHGARFLRLLARHRPRVVYLTLAQGTLGFLRDCLFLVPARLLRRRVVVHLHGGFFREFYDRSAWPVRALMRWGLGGAAAVIVLGERFRGILDGVVPRERVSVVPNGVDTAEYPVPGPRTVELPYRVLYLGAIARDKGVLDLIEAFAAARGGQPDVVLVLAGELFRHDEADIAAAIRRRGLERAVEFLGTVTGGSKFTALAAADLLVFPSDNPIGEGQPFVLLEAMAAGLPVVTTDIGAAADTVEDGVTGWVVPRGDVAALAAAIRRTLDDAPRRRAMGRAGRVRAERHFSVGAWQRRIADLLAAAVAQ